METHERDAALNAPTVKVMTVDDHAVFREVAREVVQATMGFEHVGDATSGEEALALAESLDPDLILIDLRMPGIDGLEAARRRRLSRPSPHPLRRATAGSRGPGARAAAKSLTPRRDDRADLDSGLREPSRRVRD